MATADQFVELLDFLHDANPEVRKIALKAVTGFTSSSALWPVLREHADPAIPDICRLSFDDSVDTKHDALRALINLSADPSLREHMNDDEFLMFIVMITTAPVSPMADLACMLLSNLTKSDAIAKKLIDVSVLHAEPGVIAGESEAKPPSPPKAVRVLRMLLAAFVNGEARQFNPDAEFHFLASLFSNVTLLPEGRQFFLQRRQNLPSGVESTEEMSEHPLASIACYTQHPNVIRRGGCISTLKNSFFDVEGHADLIADSSAMNIIPRILLPLVHADDELEPLDAWFPDPELPDELQFLEPSHAPESDPVIVRTLLESLLLLCSTRVGRDTLRRRQAYPVMRALHRRMHDNEEVSEIIDHIVQLLKRDEEAAVEELD